MTITNKYARIILGGAMTTGDQWNIGVVLNFGNLADNPTGAEMDTVCGTVLTNAQTNLWNPAAGLKSVNRSVVSLDYAKGYFYAPTGLVAQGQATQTGAVGTSTSNTMPAYVALVTSLRTDGPGRSGRGRIYLPYTGGTLSSTSLQANVLSTLGPAVKNFYSALIANYTLNGVAWLGRPAIVSKADQAVYEVKSIRLDSVMDTQRGRRKSATVDQTYSSSI